MKTVWVLGMMLCSVAWAGHYEAQETEVYIFSDTDTYDSGSAMILAAYGDGTSICCEVIVDSGTGDGIATSYADVAVRRGWEWVPDFPGDDPPSSAGMIRIRLNFAGISAIGRSDTGSGWELGIAGSNSYAYVSYPTSGASVGGDTWSECTGSGYDSDGYAGAYDGGEEWWDWGTMEWWTNPLQDSGMFLAEIEGAEEDWVYYGPVGGEEFSYWFYAGVDAQTCAEQVYPYDGCSGGANPRALILWEIDFVDE